MKKFQFKKMPFGLTSAPATFKRLMYKVSRNQLNRNVITYLDDITIYSNSETQHLSDLRETLMVLAKNRLKLNMEKPRFMT